MFLNLKSASSRHKFAAIVFQNKMIETMPTPQRLGTLDASESMRRGALDVEAKNSVQSIYHLIKQLHTPSE